MNFIHSLLHMLQHGRSDQEIVYTSLDDELFADRERAYGSYELRKNQPWYLLTATGLVSSSVLCLVFVPIWMGWHLPEDKVKAESPEAHHISYCGFSDLYFSPKPPPIAQGQMITCRLIPKKELELVEFKIPKPATPERIFLHEESPIAPKEFLPPTGIETGNTLKDCISCPENTPTLLFPKIHEFIFVDQEPQPLNLSEIKRKIHFPRGHQSGHVVFRILVDKNGNTVKHQVINQADEVFISAIAPHIDELRWTPALQEGKVIPFWVNIPFSFRGLD